MHYRRGEHEQRAPGAGLCQLGPPAGADAQLPLSAIRNAVTSAALIPGLKALVARHTGDPSWRHVRPPHLPLSPAAETKLFAGFDACGLTLAPVT